MAGASAGSHRHRQDRQLAWAREVHERMLAAGCRVEFDPRNEKLGAKIRDAQMEKLPWTFVIGDQEVEKRGVSPRRYGGEDLKFMELDAAIGRLVEEGKVPFLQ